jgi:hypothetical protein
VPFHAGFASNVLLLYIDASELPPGGWFSVNSKLIQKHKKPKTQTSLPIRTPKTKKQQISTNKNHTAKHTRLGQIIWEKFRILNFGDFLVFWILGEIMNSEFRV